MYEVFAELGSLPDGFKSFQLPTSGGGALVLVL